MGDSLKERIELNPQRDLRIDHKQMESQAGCESYSSRLLKSISYSLPSPRPLPYDQAAKVLCDGRHAADRWLRQAASNHQGLTGSTRKVDQCFLRLDREISQTFAE
jgi:hypothetical protein